MSTETPLMKQYNAMKKKHPGALLLFRVGDFYETFGEDAIKTSKILGIVLTKRSNGSTKDIALAGFPYHALDTYLPKLVKAGLRIAICDQMEDAKMVKGIVKRDITELVTPGLAINDHVLDQKSNNYLASIHFEKSALGVAFLDLSTGEFLVAQGEPAYIEKLIQSFHPAEIIFNKKEQTAFQALFQDKYPAYSLEEWIYHFDYGYKILNDHFVTTSLKGFGIESLKFGIIAAGAVLRYLEETEHKEKQHITSISRIGEEQYVWLDHFTIKNLELFTPQQEGGVSLFETLDSTVTPMGARLLKKWIVFPLKSITAIQQRLDSVELLVHDPLLAANLLQYLKQIGDIERLISKVSVGRINPREMLVLKNALSHINNIQRCLEESEYTILHQLGTQLDPCCYLLDTIEKTIQENPPIVIHQGGIIKTGINTELDNLNKIVYTGQDYLIQLRQKESRETGIPSLKISYNKVFGYYFEVSNTHKNKIPTTWIRKQTLVHAERYITEDLKEYEEKILHAEGARSILEQQIYQSLIENALEFIPHIQQNAKVVAQLDCYLSFAEQARKNNYTKPLINDGDCIDLKENRHPVIEQQLPHDASYVPNNIYLDRNTQQIMIITGPNMSGKSALLRQVALTVLMAQMGSFVPAKQAFIGYVDKIFTRVGASDNLSKGESTFMVEMTETASIVNNLSDRSLLLMDEIGRGTSTYDGIAIAWSLIEYLHNHPKYCAKTLFATHYHELNQLATLLKKVKNFNVVVKETDNKILFLHKLQAGESARSFGIYVAQMAGIPAAITAHAHEILRNLQQNNKYDRSQECIKNINQHKNQLSFPESDPNFISLKESIRAVDIDTLSPIEALVKLSEIKKKLEHP